MPITLYLEQIAKRYKLGNSTEHTFRGDLQHLIEALAPGIAATNEPTRQSCGAPDYILTRKEIPIGFIEAKNIGDQDLDGLKKNGNKEQFDRYKASLGNLIFTDYIHFHFYKNGEFITKIAIAKVQDDKIVPLPANFKALAYFLKEFCTHVGQTIKNPKKLAEMMAGKARLLSDVIEKALSSDEERQENSTLKEQMNAFKEILIHDITPKGFADVYAQTIAYGMFAARLHDPTLPTFSRQEAAELIPKSNPFLRKLFAYIAGPDLDDRIKWIVDNLVEIFLASDVEDILKNYGKATKTEDPIIHFYETFLSEYDPKLRKARGVWYTPHPVVNFIVRAVDDILRTEFDLPHGLADTSKIKIIVNQQGKQVEKEVHRVQILDPAAGTGTFLAEVIRQVHTKFEGQQGIWSNYVENHLLPRLNGFEILMASYAMAHLKLDLLLTETGYQPTTNQRFKVYLTNSLEEYHADTGTLFANWLSAEANEANQIKRDTPVMCVIGNPPYSGESANKGEWIMKLMEDYKKEPGGKEKLNERNPKWINDDYVKFIRYGQHFIEKNRSGILAFINPHGFLDNPTFRGMRWNLLKTYDKIYTIDLHGNSKKKETSPDGSLDQNVFDIQQGVSINLFIKTGQKKNFELGKIFQYDLYGKREFKYDFLVQNNLNSILFTDIPIKGPQYFMVAKNFEVEEKYNSGFKIDEAFSLNNVGVVTSRDAFVIDDNLKTLSNRIMDFFILNKNEIQSKYFLKENSSWKIDNIKLKVNRFNPDNIYPISYRPFDQKWIYYDKSFIERSRIELMQHFLKVKNIGLVVGRQSTDDNWCNVEVVSSMIDNRYHFSYKGISSLFPLYVLKSDDSFGNLLSDDRIPNLNIEVLNRISENLSLIFTKEKETTKDTFAPIDILDYIYAVLHNPTYREKYKEFLKIDFPRVPYPKDKDTFWQLVKLGGELRQIHLLESPVVEKYITTYPVDGRNVVGKVKYQDGKVYINDQQYFDHVPEIAWNFYIGGYQPAQKWLKDRKDRKLEFEDILHYQKIIIALVETHRLMGDIDKISL